MKKVKRHKQKEKPREYQIKISNRGLGRIYLDDGRVIEIPKDLTGTALHNDIVNIDIISHGKDKLLGEVTKIIKRSKTSFVGTLEKNPKGRSYIIPDDRRFYFDVYVPNHEIEEISNNQKVVFKIAKWVSARQSPRGKITKILGKKGSNDAEQKSILAESGFDFSFDDKTTNEAKKIESNFIHDLNKELSNRKDIRKIPTFTIDPQTAKDFDDALSVREINKDTFEVGIHIADVSHYVRPDSIIDQVARERATSVYLVDRTIPMLPEELSNEICSLKPNVDRLAFSVIVEVDPQGKIKKKWFGRTVIHSNKRFTYREAQNVLDNNDGPLLKELKIIRNIARNLKKERIKNGSILFDREEVLIDIDKNGKPIKISIKPRMETQSIIEEWMLLANRVVAEYVSEAIKTKKMAGFAYRIHERPDRSHVIDLANFINSLGYHLRHKQGQLKGADLNQLFETISGTDVEDVIKHAALRTMTKAIYTTKNVGHFGLAFGNYTHFTSPIRRYPDLIVHRLLCKKITGKKVSQKEVNEYQKILEHSSEREREAERAERDSIKLKQAEYMENKIGEIFNGIITGVTDWGLYVEEINTKTNGLIKIGTLGNEFFEFDEKNHRLIGTKTRKTFRLGDKITVRLTRVSVEDKAIDFELV